MSGSSLFSRHRLFALALALGVALAPVVADARAGGGFSFGSRGARTYAPPPITSTAPRAASPLERSATPQFSPGYSAPRPGVSPGLFGSGFGRGFLGGLLGAGLFGMLFGHGMFGGFGGGMSLVGLLFQLALIYFVARWAMNWFGRGQAATAGFSPRQSYGAGGGSVGGGFGTRPVPTTTPLQVGTADFNVFERRLDEIQSACSSEDVASLLKLATPEMVGYFSEQFADHARKGVINRISEVKMLQGDLSEAWSEGADDYAATAMRFAMVDTMVDRQTGRVVSGDPVAPTQSTEVWTFRRPRAAGPDAWVLSAIQQS